MSERGTASAEATGPRETLGGPGPRPSEVPQGSSAGPENLDRLFDGCFLVHSSSACRSWSPAVFLAHRSTLHSTRKHLARSPRQWQVDDVCNPGRILVLCLKAEAAIGRFPSIEHPRETPLVGQVPSYQVGHGVVAAIRLRDVAVWFSSQPRVSPYVPP